jgi:hypothetical protein
VVTSAKGNSNLGSGSGNPGGKEDRREEEPTWTNVKMVFMISAVFCASMEDVAKLALGAERVVFEKPKTRART